MDNRDTEKPNIDDVCGLTLPGDSKRRGITPRDPAFSRLLAKGSKAQWLNRFFCLLTLGVSLGNSEAAAPGELDQSFHLGAGADNVVHVIAIQSDGKILIGGEFAAVTGIARSEIVRLSADGRLDVSFNPALFPDSNVAVLSVTNPLVRPGAFTSATFWGHSV